MKELRIIFKTEKILLVSKLAEIYKALSTQEKMSRKSKNELQNCSLKREVLTSA